METEQFIAEIERRPGIYDSNCPQYQDRVAKWALWCEVCEVMTPRWNYLDEHRRQQRVKELQKRWKSLRDSFMKELKVQRELQRTGQSASRKKYIFFDQMLFLLPCLESRHSIRGCKEELEESETDSAKVEQLVEGELPNDGGHLGGHLEHEDYSAHLPRHLANCFPERKYREVRRKRYIDEEEEEGDADRMFLLSLLPTMRKLRGYQKSVIRIEIAQILHKALYEPELMPVVSFTEGQEGFHHLAGLPYDKSPASSTMSCDESNPPKIAKVCKCSGQCKCKLVNGTGEVNGVQINGIAVQNNGDALQINGDSKHDEPVKLET